MPRTSRCSNDRAKRAISLYASSSTLAVRGQTYNEDDLRTYDVIDYNVDTVVYPDRQFIEGRTHITLRVQSDAAATLTMRSRSRWR
jgi:hypothetical protein